MMGYRLERKDPATAAKKVGSTSDKTLSYVQATITNR